MRVRNEGKKDRGLISTFVRGFSAKDRDGRKSKDDDQLVHYIVEIYMIWYLVGWVKRYFLLLVEIHDYAIFVNRSEYFHIILCFRTRFSIMDIELPYNVYTS